MTPDEILAQYGPREAMEYDVAIVGAGPAGLATAIRLKQLAAERSHEISVVVLEKGSEPGAHILSGAIMDPRAINELIPDWKEKGAPLNQPVTGDKFLFLTETGATATPHALLPDCFRNEGNYIISLGNVVRWLATQAEALGVEIFPGFPAAEVLYGEDGHGARRRHRQPRHRQGRRADRELPARHGAARQVHDLRRGLARQPRPPADRALQARRRARSAELRHRPEGAVGGASPSAPSRA